MLWENKLQKCKTREQSTVSFSFSGCYWNHQGNFYQENLYHRTKENCGLLIRNFIIENKSILITKQSKLTKFPPLPFLALLVQEATTILQPPAPPIKDIKRATLKSLMTVCGTISEEDTEKTVFINGQHTPIKSITFPQMKLK